MLYVLDTDILSLAQHAHPTVLQRVRQHRSDRIAVSIISVEEQLTGWYTTVRRARRPDQLAWAYENLTRAVAYLARLEILSFTPQAAARYDQFRQLKLRVGKNDLRIASIALEHGATVVTRNVADFGQVPGLTIEDRSV